MTRGMFRVVCLMALLAALTAPARADVGIDTLYTANAIVTGTDMRQRPWGFAQCLKEVLVKVSGDPALRDDPRVDDLAQHADQLVASFDYADLMAGIKKKDDQGSYDRPHRLTAHFDPTKIDAALATLGDRPWRGVRPVVVPVLRVEGPKPPPYMLSVETPRGEEQRAAFAEAAAEFGMTARMPSESELKDWRAIADVLSPLLLPSSDREAFVAGTLEWNEALPGWVGTWQLRWHGVAHHWGIGGVNYDAAFRDIVRGVVLLASRRGAPD